MRKSQSADPVERAVEVMHKAKVLQKKGVLPRSSSKDGVGSPEKYSSL